jgi:hypothetical protein
MNSKKKKTTKPKAKPEEKTEEKTEEKEVADVKAGCFYIQATDAKSGKPIILEAPLKLPHLIRDLHDTIKKYGDDFTKQIIQVYTYIPQQAPPGPEGAPPPAKTVLQRLPVAEGQPQVVIKQLEGMCMDKGELANNIMHILGSMAKSSGLRAVTITYLVEDGDDVLTGGNTMLFTDREEFTEQEGSQLYNSVKAHAEELRDMLEKDGLKVDDQDVPKLFQPGEAGFTMPPGTKKS